jgi:hypothetical protein
VMREVALSSEEERWEMVGSRSCHNLVGCEVHLQQ